MCELERDEMLGVVSYKEMIGRIDKKFYSLIQNYEEEFSVITEKEKNENGVYDLDTNPLGEKNKTVLCFVNDEIIGFSILSIGSSTNEVLDFYIEPFFRKQKIGRDFAKYLFDSYQGEWIVKQLKKARDARLFWLNVISRYTKGNYSECFFHDKYWGEVYEQRFKSMFS